MCIIPQSWISNLIKASPVFNQNIILFAFQHAISADIQQLMLYVNVIKYEDFEFLKLL